MVKVGAQFIGSGDQIRTGAVSAIFLNAPALAQLLLRSLALGYIARGYENTVLTLNLDLPADESSNRKELSFMRNFATRLRTNPWSLSSCIKSLRAAGVSRCRGREV